jgi:4-amino-4-deoxy-L-arabinose transferase-like glycosyltransferase
MPDIDVSNKNASPATPEPKAVPVERAPDPQSAAPSPEPEPDAPTPLSRWWIAAAGLGIPALVLFPKLAVGGIWDPHELNFADLSRRIAVNLFHSQALTLANGDNSMPTLGDLGRGELPYTSTAIGFALFGLHEWAGRLPLAIWAFAAIAALYWSFKRLCDARAGAYVAIVLATTPLFFVQARTMLGDIVTMSAVAIAFSGLGVAVFDRSAGMRLRIAALGLGIVGLASGYLSRGALIGFCVPALAVGLSWVLFAANANRKVSDDIMGAAISITAVVCGLVLVVLGVRAIPEVDSSHVSMLVGASGSPPSKLPTFDYVILYLGHSLFPWSAFIPLAMGRLFRPPEHVQGEAREKALALRAMLIVGSSLSLGVAAALAPRVGYVPFSGVAFLAGIAAIAIRDYERTAPASRAMGIVVAVFLALFYRDFDQWPEKGLSAFGVSAASFPDSFKKDAANLIFWSAILFGVLAFASWLERDRPEHKAFDRDEYMTLPKLIRTAHNGNLAFVLVVIEAALVGFAALVYIGMKVHWKQVVTMSANVRVGAVNGWWAVPLGAAVVVCAAYGFRDMCRLGFRGSWAARLVAAIGAGSAALGAIRVCRRYVSSDMIQLVVAALAAEAVACAVLYYYPKALAALFKGRVPTPWGMFFGPAPLSRGSATLLGGAAAGCVLAFSYYPRLANQLSPKEIFDSYSKMHKSGEQLALLGVNSRTAMYYSGSDVQTFSDVDSAFRWLTETQNRRWLAMRSEDLPRMNSSYRGRARPAANLPVLDGHSGQIMLASSKLLANETNDNPFDKIVLPSKPNPSHPLDVDLQGQLLALGWDVVDIASGTQLQYVTAGRKYRLRFFYQVTGKLSGEWESFVHIDGHQRRFNGDHKPMDSKYPMALWQVGDYVVDDFEFALEPNFTPGGYMLYYGFFIGETRLKVTRGKHHEDRIEGGYIQVQ